MKIIKGKYFKDLTTFRVGGKIKFYTEIISDKELSEVSEFAKKENLKIFVLGSGSDILVSDQDFDGLVVSFKNEEIKLSEDNGRYFLRSAAGAVWDKVVEFAVSNNLQGIECLSGIPGSAGAAPIQNIGAYGQEIKDTFFSLKAYNFELDKFEIFSNEDCRFAYRESIFKNVEYWQKYLITEITLELKNKTGPFVEYESLKNYLADKGIEDPGLMDVRNAVLQIRSGKFENPLETGNAGSFFKNPILDQDLASDLIKKYPGIKLRELPDGKYKSFAAWFIEKAGWKGKVLGGAGVSPRHALILINKTGSAKSEEIFKLSEEIINDIHQKFNVNLEREVQLINY